MKLTNKQLREIIRTTISELDENPCWDGYEAYGTKMKDGKEVPNCVPVSEMIKIRESNLPKAPVPGQIKVKLGRAIEVINGAKLNYNQKLNLLFQFIDSLGLDRAMLNKMNTRIRTNLESSKKYESNVYRKLKEGDTEYQKYFRKELEKTGKSSPADMTDDEKRAFFTKVDKGWTGKTESVNEYDEWKNTRIQAKNIFRMLKQKYNNNISKMKDGLELILKQNKTKDDQAEVMRDEFNKFFNIKTESVRENMSPDIAKHMNGIYKGFIKVEGDGTMIYDSLANAARAAKYLNSKKIAASSDGKYLYIESINEGNAFGMAVTKAKEEGKTQFEFNGKTYKVKKGSYEKNEAKNKQEN
jgi:hypothetical protein